MPNHLIGALKMIFREQPTASCVVTIVRKSKRYLKVYAKIKRKKSEQLRSSSIRYVNCVWESSYLVGRRLGDGDETQVRFGSFEKDATAAAVLVLDTSAWDDLTQSNTMLYLKKKNRGLTQEKECV